jgi:hypothetical protein
MDKRGEINPSRALRDAEQTSIGLTVPVPLSQRLDRLVNRAEQAGARVYRKDLVAALILAAPETPDELFQLFTRYRTATAADAALADEPRAQVLRLERPKPGRRPRR